MPTNELIRGSGCIKASAIGALTGEPVDLLDIGEAPNFSVSVSADELTSRNTCAPGSPIDVKETINILTNFNITFKSFIKENLARVLFGTSATVATSTLTDLVWNPPEGSAFLLNKTYRLPSGFTHTAALTVKDATGTPVTLNPAHYELDQIFGTLKITNVSTYVLTSLKLSGAVNQADDDARLSEKTGFATGQPPPFWLYFQGNYILGGVTYYGIVELFKAQLSPGSEVAFKSVDAFIEVPMTGTALENTLMPADLVFGRVGRHIRIGNVA